MKGRFLCVFVILLVCALAGSFSVVAQQGSGDGKPQFTTYPIFETFRATELVNGRVIYIPPVARHAVNNSGDAAPGGIPGPPVGGGGGGGGSDFGQPGAVAITGTAAICFGNSANNFDATCAKDSYQGEPMLAAGSSLLVGGQNDIYPGACSASAAPGTVGDCGLSVSTSTNGINWQRFKLTRNWGGHDFLIGFDPSVAVDGAGTYYVAYGVADSGVSSANGLVVVKSTDGGASWIKSNPVALNLSGGKFEDKYWIAADRTTNRVYVAWTRNQGNNQILEISSSSNGGQTWSAPLKVNDGTSKFERVLFSFVAVAPNGDVYVSWHDYARNQIFIDRSTNGGVSFGTDHVVANVSIDFPDLGCNGGRTMSPAPQVAIDGGGAVYVVYGDDIAGPGLNMDVFITKSTNNGVNWSAPVRVSSTSTGHQYLPAIGIDSNGFVNVSYLDRRLDTNNCRTNTYLSRSTVAGGTSFTDSKVTDVDSLFDGNPNGPGDYQGIACQGSTSHPYFSDHRSGNTSAETGVAGAFEIYSAIKP